MRDIDEKAAPLRLGASGEAKPQNSNGSKSSLGEPSTPTSEDGARNGLFVPFKARGSLAIDAAYAALNQPKTLHKTEDRN